MKGSKLDKRINGKLFEGHVPCSEGKHCTNNQNKAVSGSLLDKRMIEAGEKKHKNYS